MGDINSYHGRYQQLSWEISTAIMGDIMTFGQNSLNLNFEHCAN